MTFPARSNEDAIINLEATKYGTMKSQRLCYFRMLVPLLALCNFVWIGFFFARFDPQEQELDWRSAVQGIEAKGFHERSTNIVPEQELDWRSAVQGFEAKGFHERSTNIDPEAFENNIVRLRDKMRAKAVSVAGVIEHITTKGTEIKHSFAKSPADQTIDFLVPFLSPPKIAATNATTIVLVPSHQESFLKRQAIRETWKVASDRNSAVVVLFVIAHSNCQEFNLDPGMGTTKASSAASCNIQADHIFLKLEQEMNHDLLEIPMKEDYHHLSEKILQAYNWALNNLPNLKWLAKADDDMFVNLQNLEYYVKNYNSEIPIVMGEIIYNSLVAREGKWADHDYPNTYYPNWAKGSAGHVLSRATAEYITKNSESLHRYQGEDTNIGIWLDEATKSGRLNDVTYINSADSFRSSGKNECQYPYAIMIGHELSPKDQWDCQKKTKSIANLTNSWRGLSPETT